MLAATSLTHKGPKGGVLYTCYLCKEPHSKGSIEVEHIDTVVPFHLFYYEVDEKTLYKRIFCKASNLAVVCKPCHKFKTAGERVKRREAKKKKNV